MKKLNVDIASWWRAHGLVGCAAALTLLVATHLAMRSQHPLEAQS
jgi:hypothetical protein